MWVAADAPLGEVGAAPHGGGAQDQGEAHGGVVLRAARDGQKKKSQQVIQFLLFLKFKKQ